MKEDETTALRTRSLQAQAAATCTLSARAKESLPAPNDRRPKASGRVEGSAVVPEGPKAPQVPGKRGRELQPGGICPSARAGRARLLSAKLPTGRLTFIQTVNAPR